MRVGIAGIYHESHWLGTPKTGAAQFDLIEGDAYFTTYGGTRTSMGGVLDGADPTWTLHPIVYATATPSGSVTREFYDAFCARLLAGLAAQPLHGLLLILHGAMVVEGLQDAEADLLGRVRRLHPRPRPLVVTVDFHANLTQQVVDLADLVVGYKTYPHVDVYDRAVEAAQFLGQLLRGEVRPAPHLEKPPLIVPVQAGATDRPPMRELMQMVREAEQDPRVLNVTVLQGFPYADEPRVGMSVLVTTDRAPDLAADLSRRLAAFAWENRRGFLVQNVDAATAVRRALAAPEGPVVLAEVADNVGGGSAGDGTGVRQELLRQDAAPALIVMCDPAAVALAYQAGEGGAFDGPVGGKNDPYHGPPVQVTGTVVKLLPGGRFRHVGAYMTGQPADMGRCAWVRAGGVDILLTSLRIFPFDPGHVQVFGIDAARYKVVVAKSAIGWRTAFGDISKEAIMVDSPGICTVDLSQLPYRNLRRPIFPLDDL